MSATFFDLLGTLVLRTPGGHVPHPDAATWIANAGRAGVLCNAEPGQTANDVKRIAEEAGVLDALDPSLFVVASDLPCPLPDRRAFGVAAALAELDTDDCVYVSSDTALLVAAAAAGMRTLRVEEAAPVAAAGPVEVRTPGPALFAEGRRAAAPRGPIDIDEGPAFVLRGRVVTMDGDRTVDKGWVAVNQGRIAAIGAEGDALPGAFDDKPQVETGGTIYPGLIDLHNHFVYNVLPLWTVPQMYANRNQWPRHDNYAGTVTLPVRTLAAWPDTARALVRYVEGKALIGGITTGQGIRTKVQGGPKLFKGAMRNVEETNDPRLPEAGTRVPDLYANPEGVASFRTALESRRAYFYHLAEGVDDRAHDRFEDLKANKLIRRSLVAIHCLGLRPADLKTLAEEGAKVVWSPFSNLLLYGQTLDLEALKESGVEFSIGCDWAPTGSKNLFEELKVARVVAKASGGVLSSQELVQAVTSGAARVVSWHEQLGTLRDGAMADLLVVRGADGDPYDALIDASEADVRLVMTHGRARYGDRDLMETMNGDPARRPETVTVAGKEKSFDFFSAESPINEISFGAARKLLETEMGDLPGLREKARAAGAKLAADGTPLPPEFVVELDNEYVPTPEERQEFGDVEAGLAADWSKLALSIPLDPPEVGADDYWDRIDAQPNLPPELKLKEELRKAYAG